MALKIKIACPKCKKALWAKAEQAGKRVKCPQCQAVLTVPAPRALDVEQVAAAALAEKPPEPDGPKGPTKTIDFSCPYCDEPVQAPFDLAGKQMPCPSCTRIVKVPVPIKEGPRDWRKVDHRAAAAALRRDAEPPPEGEWGTATAASPVSQQALVEAEVIPVAVERIPWDVRLRRATLVGVIGLAAIIVVLTAIHLINRNDRDRILRDVLKTLDSNSSGLGSLDVAELYRAAGEYYIGEGNASLAQKRLANCWTALGGVSTGSVGRDALLIDLGLTQIDLGGSLDEVIARQRIPWTDLAKDLGRTVEAIDGPDARADGVRRLTRRLIARGQFDLARTLAQVVRINFPKDRADMLALVGLAAQNAGDTAHAQSIAAALLQPYEARLKDPKLTGPLPGPSVLALLLAVGQSDKAHSLAKTGFKEALQEPFPEVRLGYAQGLACLGKWDEARHQAATPGLPALRADALVAVAGIAWSKDQPDEARKAIEQALDILGPLLPAEAGKSVSLWGLARLTRLGAWAGVAGEKLAPVADAIPLSNELHGLAAAEVLRARLHAADSATLQKDLAEPAQFPPLALEILARHAAAVATPSLYKQISQWDPPTLRPFGLVGLVLGDQDANRR